MTGASDPLIGLRVTGSYVIRSRLAAGGMGAVYVAVNELGSKLVVKVLLPELTRHAVIRERFDREARAAARLKGKPHIVKIEDVGEINGQQFMTMEYLHGRPLDAHIQHSGRVSPHHAFHIAVQIGRGLHELHVAGIIHRDLKPGNVFLRSDDEDDEYHVVLIDLGIAHDSVLVNENPAARTLTGIAMGTPGYMAPEQTSDAGSVTPASDIYALALIIWEMLCGGLPWGSWDQRVIYHKQLSEQPVFPPGVVMPDEWRAILINALSPLPQARPQTVYAFLGALASALPPDERLGVPGGAEMLSSFAKKLIRNATPADDTVRAQGVDRVAHLLWTPGPAMATPAPHTVNLSGVPSPIGERAGTPVMAPTVNDRVGGRGAVAARPTTLGASSGVAVPVAAPRSRLRASVLIAALVSVAIIVSIALVRSRKSSTDPRDGSGDRSVSAPASGGPPALDAAVTDSSGAGSAQLATVARDADAIDASDIVQAPTSRDAGVKAASVKLPARTKAPPAVQTNAPPASKQGSSATFDPEAAE